MSLNSMKIETLILPHQGILNDRFSKLQANLSEYCFANLYLFRKEHAYEVIFGEDIYIKGITRDNFTYLMPTSSPENLCCEELKELLKGIDFFFPIQEEWLDPLKEKNIEIATVSGDSDYLFAVEKLSSLPGRHLSSRRNLLKQFNDRYPEHFVKTIDPTTLADAMSVLDVWHAEVEEAGDYANCKEALEMQQALKLNGFVVYVDQKKPVGIALGEPLNKNTFVIHFAKGIHEYKGIYPFLYSHFAESLKGQFEWINLEQDLGIPSLAQAKQAYEPDKILPKLRVQCDR